MVKTNNGYKFEENITPSDTTLSVFEDGKRFLISFKDRDLAMSFKGRPMEQTNALLQGLVNAGYETLFGEDFNGDGIIV